jgi:hypothetical protein
MGQIRTLIERREQILKEMREIRAMRKGSVEEQYFKARRKGEEEPAVQGPYWLYTYKEKGKTVGQRLSKEEANRFHEEVEAYHRFQSLCSEYAEITERLGEMERGIGEIAQEKKRRR